jgi:hypothetical protein
MQSETFEDKGILWVKFVLFKRSRIARTVFLSKLNSPRLCVNGRRIHNKINYCKS